LEEEQAVRRITDHPVYLLVVFEEVPAIFDLAPVRLDVDGEVVVKDAFPAARIQHPAIGVEDLDDLFGYCIWGIRYVFRDNRNIE